MKRYLEAIKLCYAYYRQPLCLRDVSFEVSKGKKMLLLGVEEVGKVGEIFDPNLHSAVMHIEDEAFKEGEIVEVFQKGYKKGKHIIRFAVVKTAN